MALGGTVPRMTTLSFSSITALSTAKADLMPIDFFDGRKPADDAIPKIMATAINFFIICYETVTRQNVTFLLPAACLRGLPGPFPKGVQAPYLFKKRKAVTFRTACITNSYGFVEKQFGRSRAAIGNRSCSFKSRSMGLILP